MKKLLFSSFFILLFVCTTKIAAQSPGSLGIKGIRAKEGKVTGTIVDGATGQSFPFASIAIYRSKDSTLVTGTLSKDDGSFIIDELPDGKYYIVITFVGYKKHKVTEIVITPNKKIVTLGIIKVNPSTISLQEVQIVAKIPPVSYQIDKKVVNIDQNITSSGGTLADALQNTSSIQTDVQGNITLRGSSNFTVFIDGKPSPISGSEALQQIPSNLVQNVEIITNPSAKYDAEGSAGIINIIMKKQKVSGESGIFNVTAGTGKKYSSNLALSYKVSKFNFSMGADFTDMQFAVKNKMNNVDTLGQQFIKNQVINGNGHFHRQGMGINAGIDFTINNKNSISITGTMGKRTFTRPLSSDYHDNYNSFLNQPPTDVFYINSSNSESKRNYSTLNLDYLLKLSSKGQQLSASAYYSAGPNNSINTLQVDTTDLNWNSLGRINVNQQTEQNSNETDFRTKADYTLPIGTKGKLEGGYQGRFFNSNVGYQLTNAGIEDISQQDKLNFKDQIQASYVTFSNLITLFDYQLGLRAEYENRVLNQEIQNKSYRVNRIDFFPTIHLTKQLPLNLQLQASYTRRINRPQTSNLNPLVVHIDPQTIRKGNAGLLPEFANSFELNLEKKLNGSSFISIEGFMRQTTNLIQQISSFDQSTQITTNTFLNIDQDRSLGTEIVVYLEPFNWLSFNSSFNISNYHLYGTPIPTIASNINTWNIRINPTFKITKLTTVQLSYSYNAPTITAQGNRSGYYFSTIGVKQSLFKQKGSITLQIRDLVGYTNFITTTESTHQYKYSNFQRESQVFMLTFSYRINNFKVKQSNKQNQDENNIEQDMEQ